MDKRGFDHIREQSGKQFDPKVVEAFLPAIYSNKKAGRDKSHCKDWPQPKLHLGVGSGTGTIPLSVVPSLK